MERVTRGTVRKILLESGVDVPESASLTQLKTLYNLVREDQPNQILQNPEEIDVATPENSETQNADADADAGAAAKSPIPPQIDPDEAPSVEYCDAAMKLDDEIKLLEKRVRLKILQQQLADLQVSCPETPSSSRLGWTDIQSALPTFSGDDVTLSVRDFIHDFESVLTMCVETEPQKLLWLRRSLQGTAKIFLSTTSGLTYDQLKSALIQEFGSFIRRHDVYQKLAQRQWNPNAESIHAYILTMQALAKQCRNDDAETLQFILEGLEDKVAHFELLMASPNIDHLKRLVERYQGSKLMHTKSKQVDPPMRQKRKLRRPENNSVPELPMPLNDDEKPLCYNCSRRGHIKPNCPYPLRPVGSCFRCWKMGHEHHNCRNQRKLLKPRTEVNAVEAYDADEDVCDGDDSYNVVSVAFQCDSKRSVINRDLFSLFDTGNPNSFIQRGILPRKCRLSKDEKRFIGVGGGLINTKNSVNVKIKFKKRSYYVKP